MKRNFVPKEEKELRRRVGLPITKTLRYMRRTRMATFEEKRDRISRDGVPNRKPVFPQRNVYAGDYIRERRRSSDSCAILRANAANDLRG